MNIESLKNKVREYAEKLQDRARTCGAYNKDIKIPEALIKSLPGLYANTMETTVQIEENNRAFVITGDIEAMWLRDSSAQVYQYLKLASEDEELAELIYALLNRQFDCILYDPYANAFNKEENDRHWEIDEPRQKPAVWEQKYEIDSLCYPLALARKYYLATKSRKFYDSELFHKGLKEIINVFYTEQDHENRSDYYFIRRNTVPQDTLSNDGRGSKVRPCGLIFSGFRASDDACVYGYHIPDNLFAEAELRKLLELNENEQPKILSAEEILKIKEVLIPLQEALKEEVIMELEDFGKVYAYECDGYGNYLFMDDANVPSILSLPYLGVCEKDNPLYLRSRAAVLSEANPYYFEGEAAKGIGSPHTPEDYIWPIALSIQALTSTDSDEINRLLEMLARSQAGTSYMHEGFHKDRPEEYTRDWFAWSNSLCAYLLEKLILGLDELT